MLVERAARDRSAPRPRLSTDAIWRMFEGFAGSMALLAVTLVGLLLLRDHLSVETVALVLLLPPLVAALSGRALALVMAAFGALLFNFFFLKPYYTLSIETGRGVAAFLVYAARRDARGGRRRAPAGGSRGGGSPHPPGAGAPRGRDRPARGHARARTCCARTFSASPTPSASTRRPRSTAGG